MWRWANKGTNKILNSKKNLNININVFETNTLSRYKTNHFFENYGEIKNADDYINYSKWAKKNNKKIYIIGNGSNTLFARRKIKSLVLKNNIPKGIKCISKEINKYEITSSTNVIDVLKFCYNNSLDSFYYLASVPAAIGGALAMNAGGGINENKSIFDFVESITYIDENTEIKTIKREKMEISHRHTIFTGQQNKFIVSANFIFPKKDFNGSNPITERILWSKKYQDNIAPNCGSVFKVASYSILGILKKIGFRIGKTRFSTKTYNWINNDSNTSAPIIILIKITKLIHAIFIKKCKEEVIIVK